MSNMRKIILILLLSVILVSGCDKIESNKGLLEGKVTIYKCNSMSMAAYPCGLEENTEEYKLRKIIVYDKEIIDFHPKEINLDSNGNYNIKLNPGKYIIDINYYVNEMKFIDRKTDYFRDKSSDVPKEIVIEKGKKVSYNIKIENWGPE